MELNILEETKDKMKIEVRGVDHTFCNALKSQLWEEKGVTVAGYRIDHPQRGVPTLIVETDGKTKPRDAFITSAKALNKNYSKFQKAFEKA